MFLTIFVQTQVQDVRNTDCKTRF